MPAFPKMAKRTIMYYYAIYRMEKFREIFIEDILFLEEALSTRPAQQDEDENRELRTQTPELQS